MTLEEMREDWEKEEREEEGYFLISVFKSRSQILQM